MKFSVSEIQQYLRCRRSWDLQSPNRQSLARIGGPPLALQIGSAFHASLAAHANGQDPLLALDEYIDEQAQKTRDTYLERVGMPIDDDEMQVFEASRDHATNLMRKYFDRYSFESPLGENIHYVFKEQTFRVPIPGTRNELIGTLDGVAFDSESDTYWLVEHKTYSQAPTEDKLSTDWQICCYMWAAEKLFGKPVEGCLYDGISKKQPVEPEVLQSGQLSKNWQRASSSDAATFRAAIARHGLDEADYADILSRLDARDNSNASPFFTRYRVRIPRAAMKQTENTLIAVTREMASKKTAIIPNFTWMGCFDCNVRDLCVAMTNGEDVDFLLESSWVKSKGYGTFEKLAEQAEQDAKAKSNSF